MTLSLHQWIKSGFTTRQAALLKSEIAGGGGSAPRSALYLRTPNGEEVQVLGDGGGTVLSTLEVDPDGQSVGTGITQSAGVVTFVQAVKAAVTVYVVVDNGTDGGAVTDANLQLEYSDSLSNPECGIPLSGDSGSGRNGVLTVVRYWPAGSTFNLLAVPRTSDATKHAGVFANVYVETL